MNWFKALLRKNLRMSLVIIASSILFILTCFVYARVIPTGDQPHFLIITQTIIKYHSLDVMKDYMNKDFLSFYPHPDLDFHVIKNAAGQLLPKHAIGAPILWIIPYLLLKKLGATIFMAIVSIFIIINIYLLLNETGMKKNLALFTTLLITIGSPLFLYSHMLFVEPLGALITIYIFRQLFKQGNLSKTSLVLSGIAIGSCVWIHARFVYVMIPLFLVLIYQLMKKYRKEIIPYIYFLGPILVSGILYEIYTILVWKTFNPVFYTTGETGLFSPNPIPGLFGMFFDKDAGLVLNFPLYFLFISGLFVKIRKGIDRVDLFMLLLAPYLILIACYSYWNGGWSPPARYILVVLPAFSYYIAYFIQSYYREWVKILALILTFIGFFYNMATAIFWPYGFVSGIGFYINRFAHAFDTFNKAAILFVLLLVIFALGITQERRIEKLVKSRIPLTD